MSDYESLPAVAVIGMAGRFPGAKNLAEFWRNLRDGVESISFFADHELEFSAVGGAGGAGPDLVKAGAVLEGVDLFDAGFFGYAPREAEVMDPQHRLFLECAWEALEEAGYRAETYGGSIGVYAGALLSSYMPNLYLNRGLMESADPMQIGIGNINDFLATSVSYKLNLKGPSYTVQTACSTSLVAVHVACQALLNGECDMALAGGVAVRVPQRTGYRYFEEGILSPDGHCRAFDARAQGTILGNGVGVVVLKRLADALAEGDFIHALIRGSAINNDGAAKVGYTAPSVDGQAEVIVEALANAGVEAETISYLEAHGTGTALGDPVEIQALTRAFRTSTRATGFCPIGSVKTNIGHADAAAGIAGLIKTVLALEHRQIPPSLHFVEPNPRIDFRNSPFYVNARLSEWPRGRSPLRAAVSSLGIGGTNAHVIVEEAPPAATSDEARPWQLLLLSARTSTALEAATRSLAGHLKSHPGLNLADVAYTLQVGRKAFEWRRLVVCRGLDDAVSTLVAPDPERTLTACCESGHRPVTFMFPGQGAQYAGMSAELYDAEPTFREQIDLCAALLEPHLGSDLRAALLARAGDERAEDLLRQTSITQPVLFAVEYALARLWMSWGISPEGMIGHSIGEYVAACLAGVFSLADALRLVALRGQIMRAQRPGAMLAVALPAEELRPFLADLPLSLAAVNAPSLCTVSGPADAVQAFERMLVGHGIDCRPLQTSHAFHSAMMEPALGPFAEQVRKVRLSPPRLAYISNLTGTWIREEEATDPDYWAQHLRETVSFAAGVNELLREPSRILLEVGPGQTLSALARECAGRDSDRVILSSLRHAKDRRSEVSQLITTLGRLWLAGVEADWSAFHRGGRRQRLPLPTYPFERQRYWVEPETTLAAAAPAAAVKKTDLADWFYVPSWRRTARPDPVAPGAREAGCWLLLLDGEGVGARLAARLEQEGQEVVRVGIGDAFARAADGGYALDPGRRQDYEALIKGLHAAGKRPAQIVHLWSVERGDGARAGGMFRQDAQDRGYYSLIFLAQALGRENVVEEVRLWAISTNLHEVSGEEVLCPEKAMLLGPCQVIPQEYTNVRCRSIDLTLPEPGTEGESGLTELLLAEILSDSSETLTAYRRGHRWVRHFEPFRARPIASAVQPVRRRGVYLILGGLGRFGLLVAGYLARAGEARLILVGRCGLPDRGGWDDWLATHDPDDQVSRRIIKVRALEEAGAEVMVARADLGDEGQLRAVVEQACLRFGEIHGVVHAAGVHVHRGIQEIDRVESERILRSKVRGLTHLARVLGNARLDFCLLTSSLSPILGGLGYVAYAAANLFMDSFARHLKQSRGLPWRSINWEGWHLGETEGLGAGQENIGAELAQLVMTDDEVAECLRRVIPLSAEPQVVIATGDIQSRINQWVKLESIRGERSASGQTSAAGHARPRLQTAYLAPQDEIERTIAEIERSLLGIAEIGAHDNFFELGGSSLLAVQLVSRLREAFRQQIPLSVLFEKPTVAALAEVVREARPKEEDLDEMARLLAEIEQLGDEEVRHRLAQEMRATGEG